MSTDNNQEDIDYYDKYEAYIDDFDPLLVDRQARRRRKVQAAFKAKVSYEEMLESMTGQVGGIEGKEFTVTYKASEYEAGWLLEAVRNFYEEEQITDILSQVKGGKEASVYLCRAHEVMGRDLLAAKVYRPRQFRNLSNDAMYRQGRQTLTADGKPVKKTDHRIARAIGKKTDFGVQVQHTSWLMYEFTTMQRLHAAGACIPEPVATSNNAILMEYIGDEYEAAHTLNDIRLDPDEAKVLFAEVLRNIELMLDHDIIHGDLSAYNILYWEGKVILIDFPQIARLRTNSDAHFILERDITRVCQYFSKQGVECDPNAIMDDYWHRYMASDFNWQADEIHRAMSAEMAADEDE